MTKAKEQVNSVRPLKVVVLAAGKGQRLQSERSDLPKVLRRAAGRPLIDWVLESLDFVSPADIIVVVGYQAERVRRHLGAAYAFAEQKEQLGTGHAAAAASSLLTNFQGDVLVVYGDMPLFSRATYRDLVQRHQNSDAGCTMLTARVTRDLAYGRILRDPSGRFAGIVEQKDCTPEQLQLREVNPGVYVFANAGLQKALTLLQNDNAQGEYYLTDVPAMLQAQGHRLQTHAIEDEDEILGVNTQDDLELCGRLLEKKGRDIGT